MKWEYLTTITTMRHLVNEENYVEWLQKQNEYGADRWELVTCFHQNNVLFSTYKREKLES